jgi:prepilin-type N-terminal cleavage/methylation domain-containing protein
MRCLAPQKRGFTLIELLVVIAIIAMTRTFEQETSSRLAASLDGNDRRPANANTP